MVPCSLQIENRNRTGIKFCRFRFSEPAYQEAAGAEPCVNHVRVTRTSMLVCVKERTVELVQRGAIMIFPLSANIIKGCKQCPVATNKVPTNSTL